MINSRVRPLAFEEVLPSRVTPYAPHQRELDVMASTVIILARDAHVLCDAAAAIFRRISEMETVLARVKWAEDPSTYEAWERPDTGEQWGIRLMDGRVTGCAAISHSSQLTMLSDLRYDDDGNERLIPWVERHRGELRPVSKPPILMAA